MKTRGRPRVEGKQKITLSIDGDLIKELREKAAREGRTLSGEIEVALKAWLNKEK